MVQESMKINQIPNPDRQIPKQFQNPDFRFVRIPNKSETEGLQWDDPMLQEHLKLGGDVGVILGFGGLFCIDADGRPEIEVAVRNKLPATFVVRTPSGGKQFYFVVEKDEVGQPGRFWI